MALVTALPTTALSIEGMRMKGSRIEDHEHNSLSSVPLTAPPPPPIDYPLPPALLRAAYAVLLGQGRLVYHPEHDDPDDAAADVSGFIETLPEFTQTILICLPDLTTQAIRAQCDSICYRQGYAIAYFGSHSEWFEEMMEHVARPQKTACATTKPLGSH